MWVPMTVEAAAEIILDSESLCLYDRREIRLFSYKVGADQTLFCIIRLNESGYSIWETDFFNQDDAFKVLHSL